MKIASRAAHYLRMVLVHIGYVALFFPLCSILISHIFLKNNSAAGAGFLVANIVSALLQWKLRHAKSKVPTSPLSLLVHNDAVFTYRLLTIAAVGWVGFLVITYGFALFVYQILLFRLFFVWFVGTIIVFFHTARTKKVYGQDDTASPAPLVQGLFWPYILGFILAGLIFILSLPGVPPALIYQYQFHIKGEIPVESVAVYIDENTNCDSYPKDTNSYASCKSEQYATKGIYESEPLDCSGMYVFVDSCAHMQTVQRAIVENDSSLCASLLGTNEFPLCIGQFPHSAVWESGCATIMNKVTNENGNFAPELITGRCLTQANADLTVPQSAMGTEWGGFETYKEGYEKRYAELKRTNDFYSPQAPVWFTEMGIVDARTLEYLSSIHANPNNTDDFGRTIAVLFVHHLSYLVSGTIESLPTPQRPRVIEHELEPLKRLLQFGVDPTIRDVTGKNAFDHAQGIANEALRARVLELLAQPNT